MKTLIPVIALMVVPVCAGAQESSNGFRPLFNGTDLDGWVRVNTATSTWSVRDKMLICSGKPIGQLRTSRMYQNFILEVEWRHMKPRGNAGIFVWADDITARGVPFHRSIEVQVLENAYGNTRSHTTHGDIFPIHGAKMTPVNGRGGSRAFPTESRSKPSPEWNHYRIECRDGEVSLAVNGKQVTRGTECNPRKGYICIESEGGVVHYRNIQIKELPDTDIDPAHVAIADRGFRCLYSGVDLDGWDAKGDGWQSQDWVLAYTKDSTGTLATSGPISDIGFVFDVRLKGDSRPAVSIRGARIDVGRDAALISEHLAKGNGWNRFEGKLQGDRLTLSVNGQLVLDSQQVDASDSGPWELIADAPVDFANIYVRDLK